MAGINLVDQLKKKEGGGSSDLFGGGKLNLNNFFRAKGGGDEERSGSSELDPKDRLRLIYMLIGIGIIFATHYGIGFWTDSKVQEVRAEMNVIQGKITVEKQKSEALKKIDEEMRQYDLRMAEIKRKLRKIERLEENRNLLVRMVDFMIAEMPKKIWFKKIDITTTSRVVVEGYATSMQLVSEYMNRLEGAIYYPEWKLVETKSVQGDGKPLLQGQAINLPADAKEFKLEAVAGRF